MPLLHRLGFWKESLSQRAVTLILLTKTTNTKTVMDNIWRVVYESSKLLVMIMPVTPLQKRINMVLRNQATGQSEV